MHQSYEDIVHIQDVNAACPLREVMTKMTSLHVGLIPKIWFWSSAKSNEFMMGPVSLWYVYHHWRQHTVTYPFWTLQNLNTALLILAVANSTHLIFDQQMVLNGRLRFCL